jgi:hypothetical protein
LLGIKPKSYNYKGTTLPLGYIFNNIIIIIIYFYNNYYNNIIIRIPTNLVKTILMNIGIEDTGRN